MQTRLRSPRDPRQKYLQTVKGLAAYKEIIQDYVEIAPLRV